MSFLGIQKNEAVSKTAGGYFFFVILQKTTHKWLLKKYEYYAILQINGKLSAHGNLYKMKRFMRT